MRLQVTQLEVRRPDCRQTSDFSKTQTERVWNVEGVWTPSNAEAEEPRLIVCFSCSAILMIS